MRKFLPKAFWRLRVPAADHEIYRSIEQVLGFSPQNLELYKLALVHRSASLVIAHGKKVDNERLEYLGDAILDAIVADYLFTRFPSQNEGFLTQTRAKIVSRASLNQLAIGIGLPNIVVLGNGASFNQKNIFGNALEAIIGAMFLDMGFKETSRLVVSNILERQVDLEAIQHVEIDFKSRLLELAQKQKNSAEFLTKIESLPESAIPHFTSVLRWDGKEIAHGHGTSKKEAEQNAAMQAMETITEGADKPTV
ncbi:MAG TPA: ribonuclease III [Tenuifilaceae bacterium]|nr:ribonuclease III [Bacteroidales bacterium]HNT41324.1 ribonuclease III [Tenuifilaceae bacterium]MBP8642950.1 ribonuclease III [Bacteroidales bacterium]NLI87485.1 ribonuclease III [Bacteroidales bacterium]HNY08320.1 ribonuclease III [Tenuifilaceae bacterium]